MPDKRGGGPETKDEKDEGGPGGEGGPKRKVSVDIWDTAGQERFNKMHPAYYHRANACILVFDVTRKQTYQHLTQWYEELREAAEQIPCILVANKIDIDYNVRRGRRQRAAERRRGTTRAHLSRRPAAEPAGDKEEFQVCERKQPALLLCECGRRH